MKILYVTTVIGTMCFFENHIKMLQEQGNVVEMACNCNSPYSEVVKSLKCKIYHIPFSRKTCNIDNLKSYIEIKKLIERENYDIVHTHTPNASVITRLACKYKKKAGLRVIYTAHGFHFYRGAPLKNWLLFFPAEWICARLTDVLITINKEDYILAKHCMRAKKVEYVPGVGIDLKKFMKQENERETIRRELGIKEKEIMVLSAGELNPNKNHEIVIRAIAKLKNKDIHYIIAGQGGLKDTLMSLSRELKVEKQVHLLGFRDDMVRLYQGADIYILPSIREGLNVSIMEAMASGLPVICSKIRGNNDLIVDGRGGFLCRPTRVDDYTANIEKLTESKDMANKMGAFNRVRVKRYSSPNVIEKMKKIYTSNIIIMKK